MTYLVRTVLAVILGAFMAACEQGPGEPSKTDKALKELKRLYEEAKEKAPDDPVEWAKEDLRRGGDWEYRVVSLSAEEAEMVEEKLNDFGRDRWEVFWVRKENGAIIIYMKRPAKSYLRSVPLSEIGKAVSDVGSSE